MSNVDVEAVLSKLAAESKSLPPMAEKFPQICSKPYGIGALAKPARRCSSSVNC
jgi:hypothetical protein